MLFDKDTEYKFDLIDEILPAGDAGNVAELLNEEQLLCVGYEVHQGWQEDKISREDWLNKAHKIMDLALMKGEKKNYPWPNAANVKHPMLATAMIQYSSRTLPELIRNSEIARFRIQGSDRDGSKKRLGIRRAKYTNHQILNKTPNWRRDRRKLFNQSSLIGASFVRVKWEPVKKLITSYLIPYDLIVINDYVRSLEDAPRITEIFYITRKEYIENVRHGIYRDVDLDFLQTQTNVSDTLYMEMIEQSCFLDLDGDGYPEPYTVVLHVDSREVLQILPRFDIDDIEFNEDGEVKYIDGRIEYVDYNFIESPNGRFHGFGFGGLLLNPLLMTNTILNQLIDAGTLSNTPTGFFTKSVRIKKGDYIATPGQFRTVDLDAGHELADNIYKMDFKEPSMVLFQLLGLLLESVKTFTSATDALTGTADATNASPTTVLALIQQGLQVFTSIQRGMFESFEKELRIYERLNRTHVNLEEYFQIVDPDPDNPVYVKNMTDPETGQEIQVPVFEQDEMYTDGIFSDYARGKGVDVTPVADINSATQTERLVRADTIQKFITPLIPSGRVNAEELIRYYTEATGEENSDRFIAPPPTGPDPTMIELMSKIAERSERLKLDTNAQTYKNLETMAKIKNMMGKFMKDVADAEATSASINLKYYQEKFNEMSYVLDREYQQQKDKLINEQATQEDPNNPSNGQGMV